ncbi:hypothetical protein KQX54_002019, partial [Cotesia glomerata]
MLLLTVSPLFTFKKEYHFQSVCSKTPSKLNLELQGSSPSLTPKKCKGCGSNIVTSEPVNCNKCLALYHPGCAKAQNVLQTGGFQKCCGPKKAISLDDIREMLHVENGTLRKEIYEDSLKVYDPVKASVDARRDDFEELSAKLGDRMAAIESDNASIKNRLDPACADITKNTASIDSLVGKIQTTRDETEASILTEVEDRLSRRNNVVVFGLQESKDPSHDQRNQADLSLIKDLNATLQIDLAPVNVHRL